MKTDFKEFSVGFRAGQYFEAGFHCAEAIVKSCLAKTPHDPEDALVHATAFGGGFGRTFQEACGALSGGLIVIGHLYGRRRPEESWDLPAEYAAVLREKVIQEYGTTCCRSLRDKFGEAQHQECQKLVTNVAQYLDELLRE